MKGKPVTALLSRPRGGVRLGDRISLLPSSSSTVPQECRALAVWHPSKQSTWERQHGKLKRALREKQKQAFTVCDLEKVSPSLTLHFLLWKTLE